MMVLLSFGIKVIQWKLGQLRVKELLFLTRMKWRFQCFGENLLIRAILWASLTDTDTDGTPVAWMVIVMMMDVAMQMRPTLILMPMAVMDRLMELVPPATNLDAVVTAATIPPLQIWIPIPFSISKCRSYSRNFCATNQSKGFH